MDNNIPGYGDCPFCRCHHSHAYGEHRHFLGCLADYDRLFLPVPHRRETMSTATIIGVTMTVIAVFVYIGYKRGWIK